MVSLPYVSRILSTVLIFLVVISMILYLRPSQYIQPFTKGPTQDISGRPDPAGDTNPVKDAEQLKPPGPPYFKPPVEEEYLPIKDNFPLASTLHDSNNLPPIPIWNQPLPQGAELTPLFIGFTRNWPLLQQAVVSYIAAGWPASDIYIVDNSGTMLSNQRNELSVQNPFFLDYHRLTRVLGVKVLTTPTLLSFAQLQNFYLYTASNNNWPHYFWSHMDVIALSREAITPYKSIHTRAVDVLRNTTSPNSPDQPWGIRFFAYDKLTLVSTAAYTAIGGWDTFIPYYMTDCDFHFRLSKANFTIRDVDAGMIFDVADSILDLRLLYREDTPAALATCELDDFEKAAETTTATDKTDKTAYARADCRFHALVRMASDLDRAKNEHKGGRNYWQTVQIGGEGEPFWRYPPGFEEALEMQIEHGKRVFEEKWGHRGCDLGRTLLPEYAWKVEHDWDRSKGKRK